jgi:hypothetical protein
MRLWGAVLMAAALAGCATPYGTDRSLTGGMRDRQLSEGMFEVVASINGFTAPAELKPRLLQRARALGAARSFGSFDLKVKELSHFANSGGYSAQAVVQFHADVHTISGSQRYLVSVPDPFRPQLAESERSSFARLHSLSHWDEDRKLHILAVPVFLDAVAVERNAWDGATQVYVPPGRVTLVAQVNAVMLHGDFINLQADMEAGQSYALAATYDDGILSVRVEHEKTREPAGPTVQIPVGRPHWVK